VARTLGAWTRAASRVPGADFREVEVNGQPGALVLTGDGSLIGVWALDIAEGQIQGIRSVVNPEKLGHVGPVADVWALLQGRER
jgi:RNA polymerase sigma-70 factor, ECF subfamily